MGATAGAGVGDGLEQGIRPAGSVGCTLNAGGPGSYRPRTTTVPALVAARACEAGPKVMAGPANAS